MLGIPSFGLTYAVTILTAYLPSRLIDLTGPVIIGLVIGAEGFFGLFMPLIFGVLVDRVTYVAERSKYLIFATAAMVGALVLSGLLHSLLAICILVALFYVGYYAYLAPYWALYPDLIPPKYSGRSRSAEGVWRVVGSFGALVSGGFLLSASRPLPFLIAACLVVLVSIEIMLVLTRHRHQKIASSSKSFRRVIGSLWDVVRQRADIRYLILATACWNATLQSIQAFVVLYFVHGLGRSHNFVSGLIFPIAAIGLFIMAPLAGKLADRYGYVRTLTVAALIYGVGVLLPSLTQSSVVIVLIPIVSAAATTAMILPYALFMRMLGRERHGAMSGLFGFSRGLGSFLGPLLCGAAISLGRSWFGSTHGYAAFWLVAGILTLFSLLFITRIPEPEITR